MRTHRAHAVRIACLSVTVLLLAVGSTPSAPPAARDAGPVLTPEDVAAMEELVDWVLGPNGRDGFQRLRGRDVVTAIHSSRQGFELFRTYHSPEQRREQVDDLPFGALIHSTAARHGLDDLLLASVVEVESSFNPHAVSASGALGLMQVMPRTAGPYGRQRLLDPAVNLEVGAGYLSRLLGRYDGDLELALAAYNAGPANVARYGGVPPFPETRRYVERVLESYVSRHRRLWTASGWEEWLRVAGAPAGQPLAFAGQESRSSGAA